MLSATMGPDVGHLQQLLDARVHDRVELAEVPRQVARRGLADVADAQPYRKRGSVVCFDFSRPPAVLRRLLAHALQRHQVGQAEPVQVGQGADHAGVDHLVDQLLAQALDVHGAALGEMQDRLLALGAAEQAAGAAVVGLALLAHGGAAAHRAAGAGHGELLGVGLARFSGPRHHFGITSPARRTITVSPTRTSLRRASSSLCSVALVTVTPPTNTGASLATGVSLPVRPTWTSMPSTVVSCSCAGNLCATAQRGSRVTKPSCFCSARLLTL
jgi:hypothetical protein